MIAIIHKITIVVVLITVIIKTWDWQVDLIVSILPSAAKDELSLFSRYKLNNMPSFDQFVSLAGKVTCSPPVLFHSSKFVGEFQLQLEGEQELLHFTVRTLKVARQPCA